MTQVNEFAINLPMTSVGGVGAEMAAVPAVSNYDITAMMSLPPDVDGTKFDHIAVYMDSAQVSNYDMNSPTVTVDMVLTVSIQNPNGGSASYKMVKRIAMDKCKLACDAENLAPTTVVEAEEPEEDQTVALAEMQAFNVKRIAREAAGIFEAKGTKEAEIKYSYDDESGKGRATGTVQLKHITDKAHARHVFDVKHSSKYKDKNLKITRVTVKD